MFRHRTIRKQLAAATPENCWLNSGRPQFACTISVPPAIKYSRSFFLDLVAVISGSGVHPVMYNTGNSGGLVTKTSSGPYPHTGTQLELRVPPVRQVFNVQRHRGVARDLLTINDIRDPPSPPTPAAPANASAPSAGIGVAGSGNGGNDSPPAIRFCFAIGGTTALGF